MNTAATDMAQIEEEHVDNTVACIEALKTEISLNLPETTDVGCLWQTVMQLENDAAVNMAKRGLCYLMLKNQLPRGEFTQGLTERGIAPTTARPAMSVAKKLMELPKGKQLAFSQLSGSKLIELAKLDAEVLNDLDDADITDFGSMTVRDMRDEIKQLRGDNQQVILQNQNLQQELIEQKNKQPNVSAYPPLIEECRIESIAMGEQLTTATEHLNSLVLSLIELQCDLEEFEHKIAASALFHQANAAYQTLALVMQRIEGHWGSEITGDENLPTYNENEHEQAYAMRDLLIKGFNNKKLERDQQRMAEWTKG